MQIQLQPPYSNDWQRGYLQTNREGRKTVCLYKYIDKQEIRTTTAYAKYLMCVKLGHYLEPGQEVDHIDNDKTNDSIENLQLLSSLENKRKYRATLPPRPIVHGWLAYKRKKCRCEICRQAYREKNRMHMAAYRARKKKKKDTPVQQILPIFD